jgi:hypothetical protein
MWRTTPGNCYEDALMTFCHIRRDDDPLTDSIDLCSTKLVHGFPCLQRAVGGHDEGAKYGHAWLEFTIKEQPFCLMLPGREVIEKADFYAMGRIDPAECRTYSYGEAVAKAAETELFGSWHEIEDAAFILEDECGDIVEDRN